MENQNSESSSAAISRLRSAASIAKAEAAKRCVGEVVVRFAFSVDAEAVHLDWSRQDGMGNRTGRITTPWDEIVGAEIDPLVAGLRKAIVAVSVSAN